MNRHEGVSCDSCLKNNFRGRRYKCLICIDYDLCAACYETGATTNQHTTEHPMQCILSRSDFDLYYGGETLALEQPQAYTCPYCNRMGFTDTALMEHVMAEHVDTNLAVVCPVCASMPGGEPNFVTDDFAGHLTLEHRTGPRDLISFLDEPSGIRHGGVRRMPPSGRGVSRARRTNMQFSTSGGISSLSPSARDAVVDPIAELLSQLSGVRRGAAQPGTPSQLQQLQMQLQLERQQATDRVVGRRRRRRSHARRCCAGCCWRRWAARRRRRRPRRARRRRPPRPRRRQTSAAHNLRRSRPSRRRSAPNRSRAPRRHQRARWRRRGSCPRAGRGGSRARAAARTEHTAHAAHAAADPRHHHTNASVPSNVDTLPLGTTSYFVYISSHVFIDVHHSWKYTG